jgi:hypothetical protein
MTMPKGSTMTSPLSAEQIEGLRRYNTPTISNAIEVFNVRPRHQGFLPHQVRCLLPDVGVIVGYAVTSQTRAAPHEDTPPDLNADYYRYVAEAPGPKIAVGRTSTTPPASGRSSARSTPRSTSGSAASATSPTAVRATSDEVRALGFGLFGLNPCVSHAYVRLVGFGRPVKLAGVEIRPGDLIHADKHGVCIIPTEIAPRLAEACAEVERMERPLLEICRSDDFSLEEYLTRRAAMKAKIRE